jgi:DNA-binding MarR family transcriptional regulator
MHKDKASTARLISSLEKKELLYRMPGKKDGREKLVYLTDKGKAVMKQATDLVKDVLEKAYANIDREALNMCKAVLTQAYKNLY